MYRPLHATDSRDRAGVVRDVTLMVQCARQFEPNARFWPPPTIGCAINFRTVLGVTAASQSHPVALRQMLVLDRPR